MKTLKQTEEELKGIIKDAEMNDDWETPNCRLYQLEIDKVLFEEAMKKLKEENNALFKSISNYSLYEINIKINKIIDKIQKEYLG